MTFSGLCGSNDGNNENDFVLVDPTLMNITVLPILPSPPQTDFLMGNRCTRGVASVYLSEVLFHSKQNEFENVLFSLRITDPLGSLLSGTKKPWPRNIAAEENENTVDSMADTQMNLPPMMRPMRGPRDGTTDDGRDEDWRTGLFSECAGSEAGRASPDLAFNPCGHKQRIIIGKYKCTVFFRVHFAFFG